MRKPDWETLGKKLARALIKELSTWLEDKPNERQLPVTTEMHICRRCGIHEKNLVATAFSVNGNTIVDWACGHKSVDCHRLTSRCYCMGCAVYKATGHWTVNNVRGNYCRDCVEKQQESV